jgi:uncharacterized protein YrrD
MRYNILMQKLYSEMIGMPVFDENSPTPVALVKDVLVDPETGKVVAFLVKNNHIIVPLDVERLSKAMHIRDADQIVALEDVLRAKVVAGLQIPIIGSRVLTQRQKIFLGRVVDYEFSTSDMILSAIHAAKSILFFRYEEKLISRNSIVSIHKHSIIVKDAVVTVGVEEKSAVTSPVAAA